MFHISIYESSHFLALCFSTDEGKRVGNFGASEIEMVRNAGDKESLAFFSIIRQHEP
jgi:hypothetical protein